MSLMVGNAGGRERKKPKPPGRSGRSFLGLRTIEEVRWAHQPDTSQDPAHAPHHLPHRPRVRLRLPGLGCGGPHRAGRGPPPVRRLDLLGHRRRRLHPGHPLHLRSRPALGLDRRGRRLPLGRRRPNLDAGRRDAALRRLGRVAGNDVRPRPAGRPRRPGPLPDRHRLPLVPALRDLPHRRRPGRAGSRSTRSGSPATTGRAATDPCSARSASDPGVVWAVGLLDGAAVSRDNGETWDRRGGPSVQPSDILVDATDPDRVWVAAVAMDDWVAEDRANTDGGKLVLPGGLWRTDDAGRTWRNLLTDEDVRNLAQDPADPGRPVGDPRRRQAGGGLHRPRGQLGAADGRPEPALLRRRELELPEHLCELRRGRRHPVCRGDQERRLPPEARRQELGEAGHDERRRARGLVGARAGEPPPRGLDQHAERHLQHRREPRTTPTNW